MKYRECQSPKNLLLTVLIGSLILFASCGQTLESHLERGEKFLKERRYEAALMQFRAAADIDETSAEAQWGLARAYESQEKFLETIEALRRVADLAPDNLQAKAKLGNYYLLFYPPQIQDAERIRDDILKQNKNFIEGHILKASILSAQDRSEKEVVDVLRHAIKLDPKRSESYLALSRYFMKVNKAEDAESTIQEAIEVAPKRAIGYIEYGRFLTYTGQSEVAEEQFRKAVKAEPKSIEAGLAIASYYVTTKKFKRAEAKYRDLVEVQSNSAESRMDLGEFFALVGQDKNAIGVFKEILTESEDYARARYALAEIYLNKKDFPKVNTELEKLLSVNDQDAEALMLRARSKLVEGSPEESVKDLEEVLKKQPSLRDGLYYMTQARLALGQVDQAKAFIGDIEKYHPSFRKSSLLKIQAAFASGNPEEARREANLLVFRTERTFPTDAFKARENEQLRVNGLTSRGLANLQLGETEEALKDLQLVAEISPESASAKVNLAKAYVAMKDWETATKLYSDALDLDKKSFDALTGLVAVLNRAGEFEKANARVETVLKQAGDDKSLAAAFHFLKSEIHTAAGDSGKAETELKKSIEKDENYLPSYSAYAAILIAKNQTDSAIAQYQKVVEKKPSASVYTLIGMLEDGRGKYDEAEKHYRKALEMNPDTAIAANNLAWLIADTGKGNLDEAMRLARDVTKMNPRISSYYDTLGWVYLKKGFKDQAVEQFRQAVALDATEAQREGRSANPGYRLRLGLALHSAGEKDAGKREVAVALSSGKEQFSSKELQSAKEILGEG